MRPSAPPALAVESPLERILAHLSESPDPLVAAWAEALRDRGQGAKCAQERAKAGEVAAAS